MREMREMREGRGPIYMDTVTALGKLAETMTPKEIKHLEAEAWEAFAETPILPAQPAASRGGLFSYGAPDVRSTAA
jgi:hypothetical protein